MRCHPLFNWLFQHSSTLHLSECLLQSPWRDRHFELTYEQTISGYYVPHHSLVSLTVDVRSWTTLQVLLHHLPRLEHLGKRNVHALLDTVFDRFCRCASGRADHHR